MAPPKLTQAQRAEARDRALASRRIRAATKVDLREGRLRLVPLLDIAALETDEGRAVCRMRIDEVLLCLPGIGAARADEILVAASVSGHRRLRGLGSRQREKILAAL